MTPIIGRYRDGRPIHLIAGGDGVGYSEGAGKIIATDTIGGVDYQYIKIADGTNDSSEKIAGDAANGLDVDVTRVIPGTSATALGKARAAAAGATDTGVAPMYVRTDTMADLAGADGDYAPGQLDASGRLRVVSAIADSVTGAAIAFPPPISIGVTPTLSTTPAYSAGDAMDTDDLEFTNAAIAGIGTGILTAVTFIDTDDLAHDATNGQMRLILFSDAVTGFTENSAYAGVTNDTQALTYVGEVETSGTWSDLGVARATTVRVSPVLPYRCASTTLYGILVAVTLASGTHTASGVRVIGHFVRD